MLILLCGCSPRPLYFPPPGLILGPHPSLGLFTLSLRVRTFLFSSPVSGLYFCLHFLREHLNVLSHPSLGCIQSFSSKPHVHVTLVT
jgi:hypothetical protein